MTTCAKKSIGCEYAIRVCLETEERMANITPLKQYLHHHYLWVLLVRETSKNDKTQ